MFSVYLLNNQYGISNGLPPVGAKIFITSSNYAEAENFFNLNCPRQLAFTLGRPIGIAPPVMTRIYVNNFPLGVWTIDEPGVYRYTFPSIVFPVEEEDALILYSVRQEIVDVVPAALEILVQADGEDTIFVVTRKGGVKTAWAAGILQVLVRVWPI